MITWTFHKDENPSICGLVQDLRAELAGCETWISMLQVLRLALLRCWMSIVNQENSFISPEDYLYKNALNYAGRTEIFVGYDVSYESSAVCPKDSGLLGRRLSA